MFMSGLKNKVIADIINKGHLYSNIRKNALY